MRIGQERGREEGEGGGCVIDIPSFAVLIWMYGRDAIYSDGVLNSTLR